MHENHNGIDTLSEVSVNPLITQDIHLCSEHKKIRKLFDFIRVCEMKSGMRE